jgi:DNA-binding NtrC family response regulator
VLVIDDDEDFRTLIRAMLNRVGHHVEEASDGAEGLRAFGKNPPDIVLTDISMPGIDGHEVINALKAANKSVPVIAISGGSSVPKDELLLKASQLGAAEIIMKPFEFEQLAGAVSRALGR